MDAILPLVDSTEQHPTNTTDIKTVMDPSTTILKQMANLFIESQLKCFLKSSLTVLHFFELNRIFSF